MKSTSDTIKAIMDTPYSSLFVSASLVTTLLLSFLLLLP